MLFMMLLPPLFFAAPADAMPGHAISLAPPLSAIFTLITITLFADAAMLLVFAISCRYFR